jgi:hypothetical protein
MADIGLNLDISDLLSLGKDLEQFEGELNRSVALLSAQTHLHIIESAHRVLHARREIFIKALAKPSEVSPGVWMITLGAEAGWIEEGGDAHSMVKDLLGDDPKTAKDGSKFRVIPFSHKGGPASNTSAENELVGAIKNELKKLRIPWAGIERNEDGSPKSGTLHRINMTTPNKPVGAESGPGAGHRGYGHGAEGAPMVGPTGIPFLQGLKISQSPLFGADGKPKLDAKGKQMASRDISTFRIVSSKHIAENRWVYPAKEGIFLMDKAMEWAEREWDSKILPDLVKKLGAS